MRHNGLNKFEGVIDFLISNCCEIWVVAEDEDVDDIDDAVWEVEDMIGRNEERVSTRNIDAELILHLIKAGLFCLEILKNFANSTGYYTLRDTTEPKFYDNTDFNHVRDGRPLICRNFSHINI